MTGDEVAEACRVILKRGDKPVVPEVLPLVRAYYNMPGCSVGGVYHIVLDDGNAEQHHIDWCVSKCWEYVHDLPEFEPAEYHLLLGQVLQRMSQTQRKKLYATKYNREGDGMGSAHRFGLRQRRYVPRHPGARQADSRRTRQHARAWRPRSLAEGAHVGCDLGGRVLQRGRQPSLSHGP